MNRIEAPDCLRVIREMLGLMRTREQDIEEMSEEDIYLYSSLICAILKSPLNSASHHQVVVIDIDGNHKEPCYCCLSHLTDKEYRL